MCTTVAMLFISLLIQSLAETDHDNVTQAVPSLGKECISCYRFIKELCSHAKKNIHFSQIKNPLHINIAVIYCSVLNGLAAWHMSRFKCPFGTKRGPPAAEILLLDSAYQAVSTHRPKECLSSPTPSCPQTILPRILHWLLHWPI